MKNLTEKQQIMLSYIKDFALTNGYAPTIREIMSGLGYRSSGSVHELFTKLIEHGDIIPVKGNSAHYKVAGLKYVEELCEVQNNSN